MSHEDRALSPSSPHSLQLGVGSASRMSSFAKASAMSETRRTPNLRLGTQGCGHVLTSRQRLRTRPRIDVLDTDASARATAKYLRSDPKPSLACDGLHPFSDPGLGSQGGASARHHGMPRRDRRPWGSPATSGSPASSAPRQPLPPRRAHPRPRSTAIQRAPGSSAVSAREISWRPCSAIRLALMNTGRGASGSPLAIRACSRT